MLIQGDARAIPLGNACVQTVVTSPPYWGLRDYGTPNQIGLEPTPDIYVASLVAVFREVWRVLREDGTAWLNLGDSYAGSGKFRGSGGIGPASAKQTTNMGSYFESPCELVPDGCKVKDLVGIPWRVAFALQADGWYLRSDIIWSKPNPMPESVTDRPTKSHEYLFLLSKSERYWYDADAIKEPYAESTLREAEYGYRGTATKEYLAAGVQDPSATKSRIVETIRRRRGMVDGVTKRRTVRKGIDTHGGGQGNGSITFGGDGRNKRSVWTVPTMPYAGAHFATMPEALVVPCILAGCPLGGLVLDSFVGSGTVVAVAARLGRRAVGIDLAYQDLAATRTRQRGLSFCGGHP